MERPVRTVARLEALSVLIVDRAEPHVFEPLRLVVDPLRAAGGLEAHVEVVLLGLVRDVDDPIRLQLVQTVLAKR